MQMGALKSVLFVTERQNRKHYVQTNKRDTRHLASGCKGDRTQIPAAVYTILHTYIYTYIHTYIHIYTERVNINLRVIAIQHINICIINQSINPIHHVYPVGPITKPNHT
jgi:hypothetical protein